MPWRGLLWECAGLLVAGAVCLRFGPGLDSLLALTALWLLALVAMVEYDTLSVPAHMAWGLAALGLVVNTVGTFVPFPAALLGFVGGYGGALAFQLAWRATFVREGIDRSTLVLIAALGAWAGALGLAVALFCAALGALAVVGLWRWMNQRGQGRAFPFAPFLAAGFALVLLAPAGVLGAGLLWLTQSG